MFSKFLELDPEKRERIINAAIKEFAAKGYNNASTNEIVKEAGISKGLLFHYFKSKKNIFLFVYDYSVEVLIKEFYRKVNLGEKDILKRFRQMFILEYELFNKHPGMYEFFKATLEKDSSEVKTELEERNQELLASSSKTVLGVFDHSRFREGIEPEKVIKIMMWSFEGFLNSIGHRRTTIFSTDKDQFNKLLTEVDGYLEVFKKCFYK